MTPIASSACLAVAVLAVGASAAHAQAVSVAPNDPNLRYEGRWDVKPAAATTVNSGSRLFVRFTGPRLAAAFDTSSVTNPAHLLVAIDGGPMQLRRLGPATVELAPAGLGPGPHDALIAVKDVDERANRWTPPLRSGLVLTGLQLSPGANVLSPPAPTGPRMEFLGDSITQGVRAVGAQIGPNGADATVDYAWLTGTAFGAQFAQVGFGAQGIVVNGGGGVPNAGNAFALNFQGSPVDPAFVPQAVVINQGTNDAGASSATFRPAYLAYLRQVRAAWPDAWIFALRPFNGAHAADIEGAVADAADARAIYVDTTDWLHARADFTDSLHPTAAAHVVVAQRLIDVIVARTGWAATRPSAPSARVLTGLEDGDASAWSGGDLVSSVAVTQTAPATGAAPYDGTSALAVTSAAAPYLDWRTVTYRPAAPIAVAARVSDLFAFVAPARSTTTFFDAQITVRGPGGREKTETAYGLQNIPALPWNRVAIDLRDWTGPIDSVTVGVRGEGSATGAPLSFQLDDLGLTEGPVAPTETQARTPVGGAVAATLALSLGAPATFGAFVPGVDRTYDASTTATVTSTAAEATLSTDGGRLSNGPYALSEPLQIALSKAAWKAPVSNDPVTITFKQHVGATEPLRTGTYSKTLTFTLSTTTP
jgi:lysophospholipase L1-like esterase